MPQTLKIHIIKHHKINNHEKFHNSTIKINYTKKKFLGRKGRTAFTALMDNQNNSSNSTEKKSQIQMRIKQAQKQLVIFSVL